MHLSTFNKYICYPDFAHKFLIQHPYVILSQNNYHVYLRYVFTNFNSFSPVGMKAIMILESIYPQRVMSESRLIILKFTKTRCHSSVFLRLSWKQFCSFFMFFNKRPQKLETLFNSYLKQTKYFVFPGFISLLRFPSWDRLLLLSYHCNSNQKGSFLFQKSYFFD